MSVIPRDHVSAEGKTVLLREAGVPRSARPHVTLRFTQHTCPEYVINATHCALLWKCKNDWHDPLLKNLTVC